MFNKVNKIFLPNNTDLVKYCKTNKVIIMDNCKTFSEQICEKLRDETLNYNKYENETQGQEDLRKSASDSKKNEIRMILSDTAHRNRNIISDIISNYIMFMDYDKEISIHGNSQ